jgi:hypothetical protein
VGRTTRHPLAVDDTGARVTCLCRFCLDSSTPDEGPCDIGPAVPPPVELYESTRLESARTGLHATLAGPVLVTMQCESASAGAGSAGGLTPEPAAAAAEGERARGDRALRSAITCSWAERLDSPR